MFSQYIVFLVYYFFHRSHYSILSLFERFTHVRRFKNFFQFHFVASIFSSSLSLSHSGRPSNFFFLLLICFFLCMLDMSRVSTCACFSLWLYMWWLYFEGARFAGPQQFLFVCSLLFFLFFFRSWFVFFSFTFPPNGNSFCCFLTNLVNETVHVNTTNPKNET